MDFNLVVIGSGLSSLSFIDAYLEKKGEIDVISPDFHQILNEEFIQNSHLYNDKNLPPQMKYNLNKIKNYFSFNKFIVEKNTNVMGSLEFGGLSNYWGLQIDKSILSDASCLSKKNNKKLQNCFFEIVNKLMLLGNFNTSTKFYSNDFKVDRSFDSIIKKGKIGKFKITKPILAISHKKLPKKKSSLNNKINLNAIKENVNKINAKNYYKRFLKSKNIRFHNYYVKKIYLEKNKVKLICSNKYHEKIFYAKKVIFGCGTLVTTKLIMDSLKIKKEVKVKEHPRMLSLFLSKYNIENYLEFMPSQMQIRNDQPGRSFLADFRPGNKFIINAALKIYKFLSPFKFLLYFFKNYMIFSNILLDSKYSNLFMKLGKNSKTYIYSKNKKTSSILNNAHKEILKLLINEKLILPLYKNFFSGHGSAYHYFGTIPIADKKQRLSVNDFCQLKNFKNVYIIDGSVFDFKINKYPLGAIMANARRIAKEI